MANCKYDGTKIPSGVSTQGGYKTHGAFPVPCGTDSSAAAPAPQAEGTSAYPITEGNSNWKYAGAAPAETAGPTWCKKCRGNWRADMLGRCLGCGAELVQRANSLDSTENAGNGAESDTSGPTRETAGEMTAEQFWQSKEWRKLELATPTQTEDQYWLRFAEAFAKQRVEQAERLLRERTLSYRAMADSEFEMRRKVADLERERDRWKAYGAEESRKCLMVDKIIDQQESELREMREALADFVQQLKRALQRNKEAELVELIANGNRLLARKAGS